MFIVYAFLKSLLTFFHFAICSRVFLFSFLLQIWMIPHNNAIKNKKIRTTNMCTWFCVMLQQIESFSSCNFNSVMIQWWTLAAFLFYASCTYVYGNFVLAIFIIHRVSLQFHKRVSYVFLAATYPISGYEKKSGNELKCFISLWIFCFTTVRRPVFLIKTLFAIDSYKKCIKMR